jgi:hypothetical protein
MTTNQKPPRSSCWCRRTISRKRRRTRLRTTAPPSRRAVTKPARHGPQFSIGAVFNIRRLPRCVTPFRFTHSYSDRCVSRRVFGKENELGCDIASDDFPIPDWPISRATSQPVATPHARLEYKRSLPPKIGGRLHKKDQPGSLFAGRLSRCFRCFSRRFSCRSRSFRFSGTGGLSCYRRTGGRWSCRRSDVFGFLLAGHEKRGTGQDADVFLHNWRPILL